MTLTATKDEREILSRLCDDLATKHAPLYRNAHIILKSALDAPAKNGDHRAALEDMFALIQEGFLVRNTDQDGEPGWAIKQLPFISRLAIAKKALNP